MPPCNDVTNSNEAAREDAGGGDDEKCMFWQDLEGKRSPVQYDTLAGRCLPSLSRSPAFLIHPSASPMFSRHKTIE